MTSIPSFSRSELNQRRQNLRRDRHLKLFQAVWRTLAGGGLLVGLVWGTTRPIWVLRESKQVAIAGNHLLSEKAIRSILPLSYPKSLLHISPLAIARSLKSQPAIADATVSRQLFPPGITVQLKERVPVALALSGDLSSIAQAKLLTGNTPTSVGLLDQNGTWIPMHSYLSLASTPELPSLKIIGLREQYRPYWAQLYQAVSHSPIKVTAIDCQDQANLILKTELGIVHIGPYSSRFASQLKVLAQMRQLSAHLPLSQIVYIDLKNPEHPLVQMNQANESVNPAPPATRVITSVPTISGNPQPDVGQF